MCTICSVLQSVNATVIHAYSQAFRIAGKTSNDSEAKLLSRARAQVNDGAGQFRVSKGQIIGNASE